MCIQTPESWDFVIGGPPCQEWLVLRIWGWGESWGVCLTSTDRGNHPDRLSWFLSFSQEFGSLRRRRFSGLSESPNQGVRQGPLIPVERLISDQRNRSQNDPQEGQNETQIPTSTETWKWRKNPLNPRQMGTKPPTTGKLTPDKWEKITPNSLIINTHFLPIFPILPIR